MILEAITLASTTSSSSAGTAGGFLILISMLYGLYWFMFFGIFVGSIIAWIWLIIRTIVALSIYASAKMHGSKADFLWGLVAFSFPIITAIVFYVLHRKKQKTFCYVNEPCFKNTYKFS